MALNANEIESVCNREFEKSFEIFFNSSIANFGLFLIVFLVKFPFVYLGMF